MRFIASLATIFSIVLSSSLLYADHFHGGSISWRVPDPALPNSVEIQVLTYWDFGFVSPINVDYGDGTSSGAQTPIAIRTINDAFEGTVVTAELILTHDYANALPRTVAFSGVGRDDQIVGLAADGPWKIESLIDFSGGNRFGPIVAYVPPISVHQGGTRSFAIPMVDFDGDPVTCRFATSAESGVPAAELPPTTPQGIPATIVNNVDTCEVRWNVNGGSVGQRYVFPIVFESAHAGAKSSMGVDFIVDISSSEPPKCEMQMAFGGNGNITGVWPNAIFYVSVGDTFTAAMLGTTSLLPPLVGLQVERQFDPPGAAILATAGVSPVQSTVDWAPIDAERGLTIPYSVSFVDDTGVFSTCSMLLHVPECNQFGQVCTVGVGACESRGTLRCNGAVAMCDAVEGTPVADVCDSGEDTDCDGQLNTGCCGNGILNQGEECDDGTFNGMNGSCCRTDCTVIPEGEVCDPANGACDIEDVCDADGFCEYTVQSSDFECGPSEDFCDIPEFCDGDSPECPDDEIEENGTQCADEGVCGGDGFCADGICDRDDIVDCDDEDICTADGCDEPGGCFHEPIEGCCDSDDDCAPLDVCDTATCGEDNQCVFTPIAGCGDDVGPDMSVDPDREPVTLGGGGCATTEPPALVCFWVFAFVAFRRRRGVA